MGYGSINIHHARKRARTWRILWKFSYESSVLNVQLTLDNPAVQIIEDPIFTNASIWFFY